MNKIDPALIRERLEASFCTLDIASEIERHTSTRLGKSDSRKQYNGACPFDDCSADTNGFVVWPELTERGCHYWCRQCGRKGDILKLVMDIKGLKFTDACKELGIPNPYKEDGNEEHFFKPRVKTQRVPAVSEWAKNELQDLHTVFPRAQLALQHERARAYLAERAIPFEIAQGHGLGYIPAQQNGEKDNRWADRIIFPIYTPAGEMGFCGRSLYMWEPGMDEDAHKAKFEVHKQEVKAHNQEVDDFGGWGKKRQEVFRWLYTYQQGFFNWQATKETTCLVFVEGPFDVLACLASGILHAISIGTTGIDASMIPFNVERTIMALDVDGPGHKAAKDLAKSLRRKGIDAEICMPMDAKDWSEAFRVHGIQGLAPIQEALQVPVELDSKPLEKTPMPIEEDCLAIVTWMESTGIKVGSRVSTPQGLGTVFCLVDIAHIRVVLDDRSDEWVKYFHSDEVIKESDFSMTASIHAVPREPGVIGTVQDLQGGGLRFSIVNNSLHVEADYYWQGGGVERFIRDHEATIVDWLRANEKPVVQEASVQSVEIKPYEPFSLLPLPRKTCPFQTLTWNGKGKQEIIPCKGKPLENGFCSGHQSSFSLLEIGAASGYPEVRIPFKWHGETLYRTINAGIGNWEYYATFMSGDRPSDTREKDVKYLKRQFELAEQMA